jgi:hypothetical protein
MRRLESEEETKGSRARVLSRELRVKPKVGVRRNLVKAQPLKTKNWSLGSNKAEELIAFRFQVTDLLVHGERLKRACSELQKS